MTQQVKAFSPEDVTFVETVAGQVAIAVENARLYGLTDERLREKVQQLEALQRVSASLVSSLDLSEVLAQMARQAWLGLAEDLGEFHHAKRAPSHQGENAQPGRLGTGAKFGEQIVHRHVIV
jgi:GAF domain-containing protein